MTYRDGRIPHVHRRGITCPVCTARPSRECACGRRVNGKDTEQCWVCRRDAQMEARRRCGCGVALRTDAAECRRCQKSRAAAARRFCGCGSVIRTDAAECSRCWQKAAAVQREAAAAQEAMAQEAMAERPFRWVRRGGIMRPVFDEVA